MFWFGALGSEFVEKEREKSGIKEEKVQDPSRIALRKWEKKEQNWFEEVGEKEQNYVRKRSKCWEKRNNGLQGRTDRTGSSSVRRLQYLHKLSRQYFQVTLM